MRLSSRRILFVFLLSLGGPPVLASDELLLCGWDEVYAIDVSAAEEGRFEKTWSWRAKDHPDLPEGFRKSFGSTDDCRPVDKGRKVLISSSGGACALVELPSGKVLWYGAVPNGHGVELLPKDRIIAAASTNTRGNRLMLFEKSQPNVVLWEDPLPSAHGVVWDAAREQLWAIGFKELRCYSLKDWSSRKPSLVLEHSSSLPNEDGHDLSAVPGTNDLVLSTHSHVYLFDREKKVFRLHPELGDKKTVKGISIHPTTGRLIYIQASEKAWWSAELHFLNPQGKIELRGQRLYRPRWVESYRNALP